jgi:hypothetical protein
MNPAASISKRERILCLTLAARATDQRFIGSQEQDNLKPACDQSRIHLNTDDTRAPLNYDRGRIGEGEA